MPKCLSIFPRKWRRKSQELCNVAWNGSMACRKLKRNEMSNELIKFIFTVNWLFVGELERARYVGEISRIFTILSLSRSAIWCMASWWWRAGKRKKIEMKNNEIKWNESTTTTAAARRGRKAFSWENIWSWKGSIDEMKQWLLIARPSPHLKWHYRPHLASHSKILLIKIRLKKVHHENSLKDLSAGR